jgi:hypothetical protein
MGNALSLVIGIVSGILTSALIFLAVQIFRKIIIPWYQSIVYQGLIIDGEWKVFFQTPGVLQAQDIILNLTQKAHRLEGTATYIIMKEEARKWSEQVKTFHLEGRIADRFVVLTLRHTERNRIGVGTLLIEIIGDGRIMSGQITTYDVGASKIFSDECILRRNLVSDSSVAGQAHPQPTMPLNDSLNPMLPQPDSQNSSLDKG